MGTDSPPVPSSNGTLERSLVLEAKAGDEVAFTRLVRQHEQALHDHVRARLSRKLRRRVAVSDVLQEVWMAASRRLADFEYQGPGSLRAWLVRIADLVALAHSDPNVHRASDAGPPRVRIQAWAGA